MICLKEGQENLCAMVNLAKDQSSMPAADASKYKPTAKLEEEAQRVLKPKIFERVSAQFEKGDAKAPMDTMRLMCS